MVVVVGCWRCLGGADGSCRIARTRSGCGAGVVGSRSGCGPGPGERDCFEEVAGQQDLRLGAEELGPGARCALRCGIDARVSEDLSHGRGGNLQAEDKEFAVDAAVAPARVLLRQAQNQDPDGAGRPGRFGRDILAWRRRSRSRCQGRIVSGRASGRSLCKVWRGSRCTSAASNALSAGLNRTLVSPSCRCSKAIWWRNITISMSLSRSVIGSRRSRAKVVVRPR